VKTTAEFYLKVSEAEYRKAAGNGEDSVGQQAKDECRKIP